MYNTDPRKGGSELWRWDLARNLTASITLDSGSDFGVFSPDGANIASSSRKTRGYALIMQPSGGGGKRETLLESPPLKAVDHWSPNGQFLAFTENFRLWILPLAGEGHAYRFYPGNVSQYHGQFSPDGKWIAYSSNETGEFEVYVQPFPASGAKWRISTQGGAQPRWRSDGKEMYYRLRDGKVMATSVTFSGKIQVGLPQMLFQASPDPFYPDLGNSYDGTRNGQRFVINTLIDNDRVSPITVIVNWPAALKH